MSEGKQVEQETVKRNTRIFCTDRHAAADRYLLNGGLNRTVSKRIEYPDLLKAISEGEVGRVAIRGNSLVGVYDGKNRQTMTADADFPERSYDFETTIGDDFIDTVRQIEANKKNV